MRVHSETAWNIAMKFSHVLASETRDLAAHIDIALAAERERCAKIAANWKSSLEPGTPARRFGHEEAARDIATAIRSSIEQTTPASTISKD